MFKSVLMTTVALATMAAAPAPSNTTAVAAAQPAASAAQETSDGGTITPPGAAVEDKKICKALPSSYSRMSKRACLTKNEWKQVEDDVQNDNGF
jgi:hypothetical protein